MRIASPVDASTVSALIKALAKSKRRRSIPVPTGVQVWLATGHTDMRKGFDGLALMVQEKLKRDPHGGHLFVFREETFALAQEQLQANKITRHGAP